LLFEARIYKLLALGVLGIITLAALIIVSRMTDDKTNNP